MKKNLLIMMMMVLCAGFVSAQTQTPTINTVRGFVPGGSTGVITGTADQPTYVVFGAPYGGIQPMDQFYEVSASIAQMQLLTDTVFAVITCQQGYYEHGFNLSWDDIEELLEEQEQECDAEGNHVYAENQMRNVAINYYYYDSLIVLNLYICPCSTKDQHANEYEVIALNNECWFKSNLRDEVIPSTLYNSEQYEVTEEMDSVFGRLYTYANVATGSCDEDNYLQGACPDGWHLITAEEAQALALIPADQLRYEQNWIVSDGSNTTGFSAQPAGVYNTSTGRYEGFFSETDYWVVKDCESLYEPVQNIVQIAYYCNTPLLIERPAGDQLSVRCVYDIVREFDKHNCIPIPDPDPTGCPRFGNMQITEDQLGFTLPIGGDYEGATVTLSYSAGIDYTVGNTEPGTTGYGVDGGETTLPIEDGKVTWHYTVPATATEDMISLTVTLTLSKGECSDRMQKNLKTVTPPTPAECSLAVSVQPSTTSAKSITGTVTGTLENIAEATVSVTSYTVLNAVEPVEVVPAQTYPLTVNQQDGTFSWTYAPEGMGDQLQAITGYVTVIGNTATCGDEKEFNTAPQVEPVCPTIGDVQFLGDQGYYFKVNDLDFEKISDITIEYTAVFTDIDDPEHTATITGTDYYDGGNGTIYYDSDQEYPFGWFFSSDEMPQFQFDLPTIYTTLTIVYDGQICKGSVSEYIEVQEPEFIDCPGLSQIITNPNYGYETTITQYDENAGVFRVEYHVYLAGETEPEMVQEDNAIFTPDNSDGSMNVSGQLPSGIWNQFDKEITKIEVFLVYAPSILYSDQCDDDEVYAVIYEATPAQECAFSVSQEFTLVDNGYRLDVYNNTGDANAITGIEAECYWHGTDDNVRAESGGTNAYDNPRFQRFSDPQDETHAYYIFYLPDPNYATPNPTTTASIDLKVTFRLKSAYSICNTPDYDGIHREKLDIPYQN